MISPKRWPNQKILLPPLFLLLLSIPLFSLATDTFTGKVIGISDGDTISVMREGKAVKVRLHGIDCPERKQPYGIKTKRFTSDMVFSKKVTIWRKTKDRYGRIRIQYRLGNGGRVKLTEA